MRSSFAGWITACVAHYRCQRYIRRAVDSLLGQSYPWVRVIVINDGDTCAPWRELATIKDPRLLRFDLLENRGNFFCFEVARRATPDPYFMMQDADDWSAPERAATLLKSLLDNNSALAVSSQPQFCEAADGTPYQIATRWDRVARRETEARFVVQNKIDEKFRYRAPQAGLIRTAALRDIGGYYGGFPNVGWDSLLTNLVLMTGSISWVPEPLYYRLIRPDSLTHSAHTGAQTEYATAVTRCLRQLYRECYTQYHLYRRGEITRVRLSDSIKRICGRYVSPHDLSALDLHARRLREAMS